MELKSIEIESTGVVPHLKTFEPATLRSMEMNMEAERKAENALRWKAPTAMVLVQLFNTGMILLSKVSIGEGMFIFALLAYRSFFGAVVILPFALFFERYAVPMGFYYCGLRDTTASYAVIFLNIVPLVTFILSLLLRLESLELGTAVAWLKIGGVLLSVGGTMVISLYQGKVLHLWPSIVQHHKDEHVEVASHHLRGTIFLAGSTITFACWYLIQSKVLKVVLGTITVILGLYIFLWAKSRELLR
ncbi:hypothetical protein PR202_gb21851 [Eleusine coracana subsp. coracana]|uniref:WAT1-related protein n=1 Tax=Eleusine coracana subsp. coracana TaxID=191504 RepID=A0AAV5FE78_ELECO|nr:hypothetical protein PR202_gb21851 [Eleusine coracana subsp. coracana]